MRKLQLDTDATFYEFYRKLALRVLTREAVAADPILAETRKSIRAWKGTSDKDEVGLALLVEFRDRLSQDVFTPFVFTCKARDKQFIYAWRNREVPLRQLLSKRIVATMPYPNSFRDWDSFIVSEIVKSAEDLQSRHPEVPLDELKWGTVNRAIVAHPLSVAKTGLGRFLNMPLDAISGCPFSVRVASRFLGASERMVVSPGREKHGSLHIPGGQSGHPLSPSYRDQYRYWVKGTALPFLPSKAIHKLILKP